MTALDTSLRQRLVDLMVPGPGGCVLWAGRRHRGYPILTTGHAKATLVSRLVYALATGIKEPAQLIRTCGRRDCVYIGHLRERFEQ